MRLEFLESGSRDCPLLRLYGSDSGPAKAFSESAALLAAEDGLSIELSELPEIAAVDACRVLLVSAARARIGITRVAKKPEFIMRLPPDYWTTIHEILDSFIDSVNWYHGIHVWLVGAEARGLLGASDIAFVVSSRPSGEW